MGYFPHEIEDTANYVYLNTDDTTLNDIYVAICDLQ